MLMLSHLLEKIMSGQTPEVTACYDWPTGSVQYVVVDPQTRQCAIIDPVWNYDSRSGRTSTESMDEIKYFISDRGLTVAWVLDTHPHADHFSGARELAEYYEAPVAIGEKVTGVQKLWQEIYNLGADFATDGRQWDRLFADNDTFNIGELEVSVLFTPGHTLASIAYLIGDAVFVHDTLFMPDAGSARADFPGGDAHDLYQSIQRLLALPDDTRVFVGHDYCPNGREPRWQSTVGEQRQNNIHLKDNPDEADYVDMREQRDASLPLPGMMLAALQVNIRGGELPPAEDNGRSYLKIPLNHF